MCDTISCGCGCGGQLHRLGPNGKPRKYLKGHQNSGRKHARDDQYWENRLQRINSRAGGCACGCGEQLQYTLEWLKEQTQEGTRPVWLPKYQQGHMPLTPCGCGCGTLVDAFNDRNQPRSYVPSHAGSASSGPPKVDWESRASSWNAKAICCACGCGQPLTRTAGQLANRTPDPLYLPGHNHRKAVVLSFTPEESSFIYGSLLGDLSITRPSSGYPRLAFTHGEPQREYAKHKADLLARFACTYREAPNGGYGTTSCQGATSCIPILEDVWKTVRPFGPKQVTERWLEKIDARALAYWYMDDGSVSRGKGRGNSGELLSSSLHTEGFSLSENELLAHFLAERFGVSAQVRPQRKYFYIYLPRKEAIRLAGIVAPYLHPSMRYKGFQWPV